MKFNFIVEELQRTLNELGVNEEVGIELEKPNNSDHGDLSTNTALKLSSILKKSPREIAKEITEKGNWDKSIISKVDIAGPGFINFTFAPSFWTDKFVDVLNSGEEYGKQKIGSGKKVNVEYVSANPTGLLHLGHGRNAAIGDTVSNLYKWLGYDVTREYYFNNAGNQMNVLVQSIYSRYMEQLGQEVEFPENGYHGEYVKQIAKELIDEYGEELKEGNFQDKIAIKKFGETWCFNRIKKTLNRMNIEQDVYYNEDSLYKEGKIKQVIKDLKDLNLVYEKDGATWLKLSEVGLEDDRVIVKSTGEPTYRLPDIAYHKEKFNRGYDKIIDVFGADHIATIPDVMAATKALGYDTDKIEVLIYQFVTLVKDGKQVKMSKRTGKSYTLDDLLDEVGEDIVRFFFVMRGNKTHLEFDLNLATENSDKNPVFYLKYAHARICSILKNIDNSEELLQDYGKLDNLKEKEELDLIKSLLEFPEIIRIAADKCEPQVMVEYLRELASIFSSFYHNCKIKGEEIDLQKSRLHLANSVKIVLHNGLSILGISAPESM
jgi:arginyl-tRNA synthetase